MYRPKSSALIQTAATRARPLQRNILSLAPRPERRAAIGSVSVIGSTVIIGSPRIGSRLGAAREAGRGRDGRRRGMRRRSGVAILIRVGAETGGNPSRVGRRAGL